MPLYQIRGKTVQGGHEVHDQVNAEDLSAARTWAYQKFGELRKGYNIYIQSFMDEKDFPADNPLPRQSPILTDEEVFSIAAGIQNNTATREEYKKFKSYFSSMVKSASAQLWNGIRDVSRSDIEEEMTMLIAIEFLPRVDRATFRRFIKINVRSKLIKLWLRKTYVNGDKTRPRIQELNKTSLARSIPKEVLDPEEARAVVIERALKIVNQDMKLDRSAKKAFYGNVVDTGMHMECLKSKFQIDALQSCYGKNAGTEAGVGAARNRSQQNIHTNKQRGEANILKYIKKHWG